MSTGSRSLVVLSLIGVILVGASPAVADNKIGGGAQTPPTPGEKTSGSASDDGTLSSTAGVIVYDRSKNGSGPTTGPVTPTTSWTPPACWYAPKYTPAQLKAYLEPIWEAESTGSQWDLEQRNRYVKGKPYKDFNKDKAGKGYWWDSYVNEDFPPGWDKCDKPIFWVDKGDAPPADIPNAVTPEILAELAYNEIRVPTTKVSLAPADRTKVNLPTWAWLDGVRFKPVSVTASVPVLGISATTTAEPVSLKIDPGTPDAETYPASGACEIKNGSIGEKFTHGKADETPPCGVTYLHSSGNGSFPLKATITWKIHWTGTGITGDQPLPDGTFGNTQDVVVQEIQAVNR
ncbi:hypothetical protein [Streptomyces sp. L2]|uniref:hypothetical protein n=1 Tax=Streptomyces sp. L2 TaxID=2162665 RepID=UPI0010115AE9|nr:hypothetical protein [Streptomyces sp. L2]